MALKTLHVTFTDFVPNRDSCETCSEVLLIPHNPLVLATGVKYIKATVINGAKTYCNGKCSLYVVYDDALQAVPSQQLTEQDFKCIKCFECSEEFTELLANISPSSETPLVAVDSNTLDFTTSGLSNHTLTGGVKISANGGNTLVANVDGLYVATGTQTPLTVVDTASVNLTSSGIDNHTVQADVRISATPGNTLSLNVDGLYAAPLSLNIPGGCETVGPNNMVRSASIVGNVLTLTSAPEHINELGTLGGAGGIASLVLNSGALDYSVATVVVRNNPSNCRAQNILFYPNFNFDIDIAGPFQGNFLTTIFISGALVNLGYTDAAYNYLVDAGARTALTLQYTQGAGAVLAPGGSVTILLRNGVQTITGNPSARWLSSFAGLWLMAQTT